MKKNRTFSSLKPIRSLLPENIKKLIKNKSYTDYDTLKNSWRTVLGCLLYTSPSPRDRQKSRMPASA